MIAIKKIYKRDIPALLEDTDFWEHSFLSISRNRLYAHLKSPNSNDDDIVLLLAYLDNELVGYMGVYTDRIRIADRTEKIGWLSTWWVHPKTKGSGIGREILNTMYSEHNGRIGISQFTPSARRVYDKSGYFRSLKDSIGIKAVLRSNLSFVLPALYPKLRAMTGLLQAVDHLLNAVVNIKLWLQRPAVEKRLKGITVDYLSSPDAAMMQVVQDHGKDDISIKDKAFFEWLKACQWVHKASLLKFTRHDRYAFSMYDKSFEVNLIKISLNKECIGFIVLQKRNYVSKVLFAYYDAGQHTAVISDIIKLENMRQNTREIICYDTPIANALKQSAVFLYTTKKRKESIISNAFGEVDFAPKRMHFGDGDCCFA